MYMSTLLTIINVHIAEHNFSLELITHLVYVFDGVYVCVDVDVCVLVGIRFVVCFQHHW